MAKPVYTVDEIVAMVTALDPVAAAQSPNGTTWRLCCTELIERVYHKGRIVELELVGDRHLAVYIRVSSEKQRSRSKDRENRKSKKDDHADGYSEYDQAARAVLHALEHGWAFRIYSDASLSGSLPFFDEVLIQEMRELKAERYRDAFSAVFLSNLAEKYSPADLATMQAHMEQMVRKIAAGKTDYELALEQGEAPAYRERERKRVTFRPGLTSLVDDMPNIHTLMIQDLSRLSRSYQIVAKVVKRMHAHGTKIQGMLQSLDFLNTREAYGELLLFVMAWLDGLKLVEVMLQNFRATEAILNSGRPNALLPSWLERNKEGFAQINESKAQPIREMVRLFLGGLSYYATARELARLGLPAPYEQYGKTWAGNTVKAILTSPALIGKQARFGKLWDVFPPLLDEYTWWQVQQRAQAIEKPGRTGAPAEGKEAYLLQGLLRCKCGSTLVGHRHAAGYLHYRCRAEIGKRMASEVKHSHLFADDVEGFFDELLAHHSATVLKRLESANQVQRMQERLDMLLSEAAQVDRELFDAEQQLKTRAEEEVKALVDEADTEFGLWVNKRLMKLTEPFRVRRSNIEREIKEVRDSLGAMVPTSDLESEVSDWEHMTATKKNRLLRTVFDSISIEGEPPNEELVPVLRTPSKTKLNGIRFTTKKFGRGWKRRLQPVEAWLDNLGRYVDEEGLESYRIPPIDLDELALLSPERADAIRQDLESVAWEEEQAEAGLLPPGAEAWAEMEKERRAAQAGT